MASSYEFTLWKIDRLKQYLRDRGLPVSGKKAELIALAYGASYFNIAKKPTAKENDRERCNRYRALLSVDCGSMLPDPMSDLVTGWIDEMSGMSMWPPTMYGDLAEYLVDTSERSLRTRLLTDYKEGKAFSYFDSKWLKEVYYHPVSEASE
jgi:SAP domain